MGDPQARRNAARNVAVRGDSVICNFNLPLSFKRRRNNDIMNRYIYFSKAIRISVLLPGALFLLLVRSGCTGFFSAVSAIAVHELGHLAAGRFLGLRVSSFTLGLFGADIRYGGVVGYRDGLIVALAGPLANVICGIAVLPFLPSFAICGFAYAALNLAPVGVFDGGRILRALLFCRFEYRTAGTVYNAVSFSALFLLYLCGVFVLLCTSFNASLFFLCCYAFFAAVTEQKN